MTAARLTPAAKADLSAIWDYTAERWGVAQAESYVRQLQVAIAALATNPRLGSPADHVRPGYRRHRNGSHLIFYRQQADMIEIVRILHERMDVAERLSD